MAAKAPLYREQVEKAKRVKEAKRSGYHVPKARQPWRMVKRATVRDSKREYRCLVMHAGDLRSSRNLVKGEYDPPPPTERMPKTEAERQAEDLIGDERVECVVDLISSDDESAGEETQAAIAICSDDDDTRVVIEISSDEESGVDDEVEVVGSNVAEWPSTVEQIAHAEYPDHIVLPDLGSVDWCGCEDECIVDVCSNSAAETFCSTNNCKLGVGCGNRRVDAPGLVLRSGRVGFTVFATQAIKRGAIIGEYAGDVTDHDFDASDRQSEYAMALQVRSTKGRKLFIDSERRGNITRFVNHACVPNCLFF